MTSGAMMEHTNKQFDQDLDGIRSGVLRMGGLVEAQVRAALATYIDGDPERIEAVIREDARVNELELTIDYAVGEIIVRRQPAARDLRFLLAVSKIVTDLERVGDEATKIARMAKAMLANGQPPAAPPISFAHISGVATGMLRQALDAFARLDAAAAARVCGEDPAIDREFDSLLRLLVTFMMEDPRSITASMQRVWIAKAFERIGDHAKNIAEQVIYVVKGRDVRHIGLAELERQVETP